MVPEASGIEERSLAEERRPCLNAVLGGILDAVIVVVVSFVLGAIVDHFVEARSRAKIEKAIQDAKAEIINEVRDKGPAKVRAAYSGE